MFISFLRHAFVITRTLHGKVQIISPISFFTTFPWSACTLISTTILPTCTLRSCAFFLKFLKLIHSCSPNFTFNVLKLSNLWCIGTNVNYIFSQYELISVILFQLFLHLPYSLSIFYLQVFHPISNYLFSGLNVVYFGSYLVSCKLIILIFPLMITQIPFLSCKCTIYQVANLIYLPCTNLHALT